MLSVDNVERELTGDALAQAIERPMVKLRIFGQTNSKERRNTWSLYATGTNLTVLDDVTRRVLVCKLDAERERPELRDFHGDPFEQLMENRGLYIWAVLTVVRGYI